MAWIDDVTAHLARTYGVDAELLRLSPGEVRELLEVARVAAHASGQRTNAPLLSYALGMARATSGASLEDLAAAVRALTGDPDEDSS